jgi:hypothetical protein
MRPQNTNSMLRKYSAMLHCLFCAFQGTVHAFRFWTKEHDTTLVFVTIIHPLRAWRECKRMKTPGTHFC